jgi:hypothetical protein
MTGAVCAPWAGEQEILQCGQGCLPEQSLHDLTDRLKQISATKLTPAVPGGGGSGGAFATPGPDGVKRVLLGMCLLVHTCV